MIYHIFHLMLDILGLKLNFEKYEFDDNMKLQKDFFLGDPEKVAALMAAVANQGKAK